MLKNKLLIKFNVKTLFFKMLGEFIVELVYWQAFRFLVFIWGYAKTNLNLNLNFKFL
jgi:hypothetical protein